MPNYKGLEYLRNKLISKRTRVLARYEFYEMKDSSDAYSPIIPVQLKALYRSTLGWCAKGVDAMADRLVFREFKNDDFEMGTIYKMNNPDTLFDSAIVGALIGSCSFIYISPDPVTKYPRLQVIDGSNATGIADPITGMLTEGYAVLERDTETDAPILEAYFIPGRTTFITSKRTWSQRNPAKYPLLVPVVYRPDARRPFGHSRISRTCMYLQSYAKRVLERSDVSAEFYSFPQRYVLGTDPAAESLDKWKAMMTSILEFTKDDNGDHPVVGSFQPQSMTPFLDQLRAAAAMFSGETGLTLDDLGFVTDNPSSSEAIKAAHESLRSAMRRAQRTFGTGFLNAGYLAACVRDEFGYERRQVYNTKVCWEPLFEPDAAMLSAIGDGAYKINQSVPGYFNTDNLQSLTGIDASEMEPPATEKE